MMNLDILQNDLLIYIVGYIFNFSKIKHPKSYMMFFNVWYWVDLYFRKITFVKTDLINQLLLYMIWREKEKKN